MYINQTVYKERENMLRKYSMLVPILVGLSLIATACGGAAVPVTGATSSASGGYSRGTSSGSYGYGNSSAATQAPSSSGSSAMGAAKLGVSQNAQLGSFLVDGKGMTLYVFMQDTQKIKASTCYGKCASFWPPLTTSGAAVAGSGLDASKLGMITRTDGSTQVTYNGWPLYYFAKDKKPGDTNGQKVQGSWFVVSPSGDPVKQ